MTVLTQAVPVARLWLMRRGHKRRVQALGLVDVSRLQVKTSRWLALMSYLSLWHLTLIQ